MTTLAALTLGSLLSLAPMPPPRDVDARTLPVVTTWYDPALGGLNCDQWGGCDTFGGGAKIQPHHYNASAACLTQWRGQLVVIKGMGSFWCRDSGGAVGVHYRPDIGLFVYVDILSREPVEAGPWRHWWLEGER